MKTKDFIIIVLGVILAWLWFFGPKPEVKYKYEKETDTLVVIDTIMTEKLVFKSDTIFQPIVKYRDAPVFEGEDSVNVYQDTVFLDTLYTAFYTASVTGRLNNISFSVIKHPEMILNESKVVTNTIIKTLNPSGWYVGGGAVLRKEPTLELGVGRIKGKHYFGASYGFDQSIRVNYKFKIL